MGVRAVPFPPDHSVDGMEGCDLAAFRTTHSHCRYIAANEHELPLSVDYFLERVSKRSSAAGVSQYRLIPWVSPELLSSSVWNAVWLAALWRFRRGRPYVIAAMDEDRLVERYGATDLPYIQTLRRLSFSGGEALVSGRYVGVEDVSPFIPESEREFLLFLSAPPLTEPLALPEVVTELNAVLVSRLSEYIVVETRDPLLSDFLDTLHQWEEAS